MTLVILAGGMGSRFGGLKQIEPIDKNGNFIIDYTIYDAIKIGFTKVVFIIKEENLDVFKSTIGKRIEGKIEVEYVLQSINSLPVNYEVPAGRIKPWGTAHAILECKNVVKDKFVVVNADDFYGREGIKSIYDFMQNENSNTTFGLVGYNAVNTLTDNGDVKRGIIVNEKGYVKDIIESSIRKNDDKSLKAIDLKNNTEKTISKEILVSMNLIGFTPSIFEMLENGFLDFLNINHSNLEKCEDLISDELGLLIKKGLVKVKIITTSAKWLGVTYKEDKDFVVKNIEKLIKEGLYPENLWK